MIYITIQITQNHLVSGGGSLMQWNNQGETNRRTRKLKGGGQDIPTMVAKEQAQKVTQQETIINIDDIGTHKELIEGVEQAVEHTRTKPTR